MGLNTRNFSRFVSRWKRSMNRAIPNALNRSGESLRNIIIDRTQRGQGLLGRFPRYSRLYAEWRRDNGLGSTPDLTVSGRMLSSMEVERRGTRAVLLTFRRNEERRKAQQNSKKRPFMGVKTQEERQVVEAFRRQLERDIR
jgi:hypothetical protein